jgi:hypothetical protein
VGSLDVCAIARACLCVRDYLCVCSCVCVRVCVCVCGCVVWGGMCVTQHVLRQGSMIFCIFFFCREYGKQE